MSIRRNKLLKTNNMKTYTITEALKEINLTMAINLNLLKSIEGLNDYNNKLRLIFDNGDTYYCNLDDFTYIVVKAGSY